MLGFLLLFFCIRINQIDLNYKCRENFPVNWNFTPPSPGVQPIKTSLLEARFPVLCAVLCTVGQCQQKAGSAHLVRRQSEKNIFIYI